MRFMVKMNEQTQVQQVPSVRAVVHDWLHSEDLLSLLAEAMGLKTHQKFTCFRCGRNGCQLMSRIYLGLCMDCAYRRKIR